METCIISVKQSKHALNPKSQLEITHLSQAYIYIYKITRGELVYVEFESNNHTTINFS